MQTILKTVNLIKSYRLKKVLKGINCEIASGQIYGIVGPNGAGKTTMLNILSGMLKATAGDVYIFNELFKEDSISIKRQIGFVPEKDVIFDYLRAEEQLFYIAGIYGLKYDEAKKRTNELFEFMQLSEAKSGFVHTYSKGMKRKLSFMCAIIHNPKLLILDEIFDGLDFSGSYQIQQMLSTYRDRGGTAIISSHNLKLVESLCGSVTILRNGENFITGSISEIRQFAKQVNTNEKLNDLENVFVDLSNLGQTVHIPEWLTGTRD